LEGIPRGLSVAIGLVACHHFLLGSPMHPSHPHSVRRQQRAICALLDAPKGFGVLSWVAAWTGGASTATRCMNN
jgi:hypothetical protein